MKIAFLTPKNFNIISGIIIIILSILLFIYSVATVVFALLILAIIMIFLGITQIINIRSYNSLEGSNLIIKYLIATLELLMGIILIISLIFDPISTAVFSIRLLGFVIFLIGLSTLFVGYKNYEDRKEYRSILIIIGLLTILFGLMIIFIPTIGFNIVTIVVALPLLFIGMTRILKGILS